MVDIARTTPPSAMTAVYMAIALGLAVLAIVQFFVHLLLYSRNFVWPSTPFPTHSGTTIQHRSSLECWRAWCFKRIWHLEVVVRACVCVCVGVKLVYTCVNAITPSPCPVHLLQKKKGTFRCNSLNDHVGITGCTATYAYVARSVFAGSLPRSFILWHLVHRNDECDQLLY